jgi:hypothetical protein
MRDSLDESRLRDLFEKPDLVAFPVVTGTAANSLALACCTPPWGAIYCHPTAHIASEETNAPEFFTSGARLFRIDGAAPSFVVINESYFPGWEARVDGSSTPIVRTNAIVRGLAVEAGSHVVELVYRPRAFRWGAAISLASTCVLGLAAFARRRRAGQTVHSGSS